MMVYNSKRQDAPNRLGETTNAAEIKRRADPAPVILPSKLGTGNVGIERATIDGVMLFDPNTSRVVVSVGGVWKPLAWADEIP